MNLETLGICQAVELLGNGNISSSELVTDCQKRIDEFEPDVQAWAWQDREYAQRQAQSLDEIRKTGRPVGKLHGIPVGIKDIVDTSHIPTEHGSPIFAGRLPANDASIVARLRQQGAIIMGKTVTAGLATFMPGKTTNPHNYAHTPGGSSSGSAAAVAAFMVPGAVGTQTNGSVIRPAAFCGTIGFKPSYGLIPRTGILRQSPFLDQVGVFSRSVEDAALLAEVMTGPDPLDQSTLLTSTSHGLSKTCAQQPPLPPKIAFIKTPAWEQADLATREGFAEVVDELGGQVDEVSLPTGFDDVWSSLQTVNDAEMATWYAAIFSKGKEHLDANIIQQIERGQKITVPDYLNAMQQRSFLNNCLEEIFDQYDALITPPATGEAPAGLNSTGDPVFCTPWTFCGVPVITLPLLQGENKMPIGVQVVGQLHDDGRLLRTAKWINEFLNQPD